ncbi:MAG: PEP-CTERM sorting domain-containing protein [Verrucomicrobiaceae bacterium]
MKNKFLTLFGAALLGSSLGLQAVTLIGDDFDGNSVGTINPSGGLTTTIVTDPLDGSNNVLQINLNGGGQWQSILSGPNIALPANTIAGVDSVSFTYRVMIPSGSVAQYGPGTSDSLNSLVRLNGTQPDSYPPSFANAILPGTFPLDTWVTINDGGVIPANDNTAPNGPVTGLFPILSLRDISNDNVPGLFGYIDDISFSVTESVPEPSSLVLTLLGAAGLLRRRR